MFRTDNSDIGNRSIENVYNLGLTHSRKSHPPIAPASNKSRFNVCQILYCILVLSFLAILKLGVLSFWLRAARPSEIFLKFQYQMVGLIQAIVCNILLCIQHQLDMPDIVCNSMLCTTCKVASNLFNHEDKTRNSLTFRFALKRGALIETNWPNHTRHAAL
jgi:hypothetical protein